MTPYSVYGPEPSETTNNAPTHPLHGGTMSTQAHLLTTLMVLTALLAACGDDTVSQDLDDALVAGDEVIFPDNEAASWSNRRATTGTTGVDPTVDDGDCGHTPNEATVFKLMNEDRVDNGLEPLNCSISLVEVARLHSEDMSVRGYFSHVNPEGEQPWDRLERYGVTNWQTAGENIARGDMTPAVVERAWMNSPGHRANILNPNYTHIGVGVFRDGNNTSWTQLFARF